MNPLLQVEKLDFTYDSEPVLKNVGFSVNKMEFIGLIGPNGSGKSTLLKLMGGVLSCDQGEIFYNNRPTKSINKKELARSITWIPQEHPMVFPFTIQEIVLMGRHPYLSPLSFEGEEDYRISRHAMETTQTLQFAERYFNEISGGEKQRVSIARALVKKPLVILADEPTGNLDPNVSDEILDLLEIATDSGAAVLMSTHNFPLIQPRKKRFIELNEGRLVIQ